MWRARWAAAAAAAVQFALYQPDLPGLHMPFPRYAAAAYVVGYLTTVNLVALACATRWAGRPRRMALLGAAEVAADLALVTCVVLLFSFDRTNAFWSLLVLPAAEGAMRFGVKGAAATGLGAAGAGALVRIIAPRLFPTAQPLVMSNLVYRLGLLAMVVAACAVLARDIHRNRALATRHAELLKVVAGAASSPGREPEVTLVRTARALGFEVAAYCALDGESASWEARSVEGITGRALPPQMAGVPEMVQAGGRTVVLQGADETGAALHDDHSIGCAVGVGVWVAGALAGALAAGRHGAAEVSAEEVEALELLAAQAGATLSLAHQATHDQLTGLPNRAHFSRAHHEAGCSEPDDPTAVLFIDLDRFKNVNDSLGHAAGDELLVSVADRLSKTLRPEDVLARHGGDEFTVLLHTGGEKGAVRTADRLLGALKEPFRVAGQDVYVSASVGIAAAGTGTQGLADGLRWADMAMYGAKSAGRGRWALFEPSMAVQSRLQLDLANDLRRAVEREELFLVFQPIVALGGGEVRALEALVRWRHPRLGVLTPDAFIPLAEETGMICELGRWVLAEACGQAELWGRNGCAAAVTVNVSGVQLRRKGFEREVLDTLASTGLDPGRLVLEVTETVVAVDAGAVSRTLEPLARLGVRIALDDFGRGSSSLTALVRLPLDLVKLDKGFVERVTLDARDSAVAESLVALGGRLGIGVVAEGIETAEQAGALAALGCELGQGYFLGFPAELPLDAPPVWGCQALPAAAAPRQAPSVANGSACRLAPAGAGKVVALHPMRVARS